ncbi:bifunctional UDP-N-acetylglucosamine diphosphorylase/glucosamine-1-phosphate N-acetyltransferase GlmU [Candidatus Babeliales bacterium]|nr:bifunctional UDP-N-acetylglucosamine diphosphorylase/glucosamine-1-phosphate N-acetyltransferase GlmU [Candidatus Babeliales bacterium]
MINKNIRAIVLAAGNSSRFNTKRTKQLEPICGYPMLLYPLKVLNSLNILTTLVVGRQSEDIKKVINDSDMKLVDYAYQEERLGTGDAVKCSKQTWDKENILVLNGDVPLINEALIKNFYEKHKEQNSTITFLTSTVIDPGGYGRVVRENGKVRIVEEKDCSEEEKDIDLINSGIYLIKKEFLENNIDKLDCKNISGEFYITDLIKIAENLNEKIQTLSVPYDYVRGVNTLEELWVVEQIKRSELIKKWMAKGVRFILPQTVHIDQNVKLSPNVTIDAGVQLLAGTIVESGSSIGAYSILKNSKIKENSIIHPHSVLSDSEVGICSQVGPFAHLRNNVVTEEGVVIGNFVEVKKSKLGAKTKAKHLSYLGDATVGNSVNIGAGTITCNHDGVNKHKTRIEDGAYIGSNSTLIAPVTIGRGAYTAAGSPITRDVPENDLAIARVRQVNKTGYAKKMREKNAIKNGHVVSAPKHEKQEESKRFSFFAAVRSDDFSETNF